MDKFANLVTEAAHSLEVGVELKMPDEQYGNIPATQTSFSKAAVDRCVIWNALVKNFHCLYILYFAASADSL